MPMQVSNYVIVWHENEMQLKIHISICMSYNNQSFFTVAAFALRFRTIVQ